MFIPIPTGRTITATVSKSFWKLIACGNCKQHFACQFQLKAQESAGDPLFLDKAGAEDRAIRKAEADLAARSQQVKPIAPCPYCGFYQADMVKDLKGRSNAFHFAGVLAGVSSVVPLACRVAYGPWITGLLAILGIGLFAYGYQVASRWDPNSGDPEARKALGRKQTVWGEKLNKLFP
ncbi:MAG: hypothetical protein ACLP9L_30705 [Thermoguttaceae bacterium]